MGKLPAVYRTIWGRGDANGGEENAAHFTGTVQAFSLVSFVPVS